MSRTIPFSKLTPEHQDEIVGNLGEKVAESTRWQLDEKFPTEFAASMAWDTSVVMSDYRIRSLAAQIESSGTVRPILVDDLDVEEAWMEGRHRAIAAESIGMKTIPALVRVA